MNIISHSVLPVALQRARFGPLVNTHREHIPYSVLIESARQNLPADNPERIRIEQEKKEALQYAETPRIEITERDFKSDKFLDALAFVCARIRNECRKLELLGRLDYKAEIAKMYRADELEEHYIKVQGAFCYFKKSKLPRTKRVIVSTLFNSAIEYYRQKRNAEARTNYRIRKIKNALAEEGVENFEVKKIVR